MVLKNNDHLVTCFIGLVLQLCKYNECICSSSKKKISKKYMSDYGGNERDGEFLSIPVTIIFSLIFSLLFKTFSFIEILIFIIICFLIQWLCYRLGQLDIPSFISRTANKPNIDDQARYFWNILWFSELFLLKNKEIICPTGTIQNTCFFLEISISGIQNFMKYKKSHKETSKNISHSV